ncbi:MAG: FAD:protein FMN transferase [Planctomycetes bacterium]|nr:FAD:protein FMN transferase [Planctomycetota bacterium]
MLEACDNGGRAQPFPLRRFKHDAMACTFELAPICEDAAYAEQAARAAFTEIDRLERELSRFIPTSDIARINALEAGKTIRIGIEAAECLQLAAQIYVDTKGAFDVTYARRRDVAAGPRTGRPSEPEAHARASAAPLELDPKSRCVRAHAEGVRVDLGGIGKGYAIDQVLQILGDWSIDAGLIQSGQSSVFALGVPSGSEHWSIALRDPVNHDETLQHVSLANAALSGSGRKLHGDHIIDPRSGRPVVEKLGTWALAPSAALSDALSTAFIIMSPDEVATYCQEHTEVSALLLLEADDERKLLRFGPGLAAAKQ